MAQELLQDEQQPTKLKCVQRSALEQQLEQLMNTSQVLGTKASSVQLQHGQQNQAFRTQEISNQCSSIYDATTRVIGQVRMKKAMKKRKESPTEVAPLAMKRTKSMHPQRAMDVIRKMHWLQHTKQSICNRLMKQWKANTEECATNGIDQSASLKVETVHVPTPAHSSALSTGLSSTMEEVNMLSRTSSILSVCTLTGLRLLIMRCCKF